MMKIHTDRIRNRLDQLITELVNTGSLVYYDRLRAFRQYCDSTPALASCLAQLPQAHCDFRIHMQDLANQWPESEAGYAFRWDAINQAVDGHSKDKDLILFCPLLHFHSSHDAYGHFTGLFVVPLYHYLIDQLEASSTMLYLLLRYKRWAEWFQAERLREDYRKSGEDALDTDLRRFLFESGIDYPFSQPHSPGGRADVVAGLETDDPLVLETKVWDSKKGYKENRVRDGLRQAMDYAAKYGKDKGYVAVFNLDPDPLVFVGGTDADEWPARIERGRTYYFIEIDIAEQAKPVSQRDRGKPVKRNEVQLAKLWDDVEGV